MLTGRLAFAARHGVGHDREDSRARAGLVGATGGDAARQFGALLLRCLAKDPKQRLRDIGDIRIEIDAVDEVRPEVREITVAPARNSTRPGCLGLHSSRSPWVSAYGKSGARRPRSKIRWSNATFSRAYGLGEHRIQRRTFERREVPGVSLRQSW